MSRLVGTVRFRSTIDGSNMPQDAERVGMQAGRQGAKGFNEEWDKEFRKGLTQQGKAQLEHWKRRGSTDGLAYGRGLEIEVEKFAGRLNKAFDDFQGIQVNSSFMDEWGERSRNVEADLKRLHGEMDLLNRQGSITDTQFRNATETIDRWAQSHRKAVLDLETTRVEVDRVSKSADGLSLKWSDLSHNTRQWTLIIGAVTAALPELAGLSSAAGSGLLALGGAATGAAFGIGATVSALVGLNKDLDDLPANLRPARAGLDDFKQSFSDLNAVITEAAFLDSERSWRSLASTVRALAPDFALVGDRVGDLLDDLSAGLAPGTRGFENLSAIVREGADQFDSIARSAGKFGDGLLSAFANPQMQRSVRELLGWIDELATGFDEFAKGDSFDDWLRHGRAVFGEMGDLLNTTGRLLNDLVTPASINNLTTFLDDIGTFLDTGGRGILTFADAINLFGLAARALAEIGTALEPIREPIVELAGEINRLVDGALEGLGSSLEVVATVAAPVVQALADIASAIPEEALEGLGGAAVYAAGAFLLLGGQKGIASVVAQLQLLAPGLTTKAAAGMQNLAGKAGLVGAAIIGIPALAEAAIDGLQALYDYDPSSTARNLVSANASIATSFEQVRYGAQLSADGMGDVLDRMGDLDNFFTYITALDDVGSRAVGLADALQTLDPAIAQIANSSVSSAASQFAAWVKELGATDEQAMNMLENMPEFKDVLERVAAQTGATASDTDLLALALGRATVETEGNKKVLVELGDQAGLTRGQVDDLAAAIRGFGDQTLSARDADRQFQAALDDLTASVAANGTSLDINTEQGRANEAALDQIAQSALEAAAAKVELTGREEDGAAAIRDGRDALIEQLAQFGIVGGEAEAYADKLGLIPDDIDTLIKADTAAATADVDRFVRTASGKVIKIRVDTDGSVTFPNGRKAMASGGLLSGPRHILAGEAGPEAIVPLNRALGQVDPSVRWLSAIAQGKTTPAMANGGVVGGGKQVTIEAGAIVIQGSNDGRATALEVVDAIAEYISS